MAEPSAGRGRSGGTGPAPTRAASGRAAADPARLAALDVLKAVRVDQAYTNLVLPTVLRQHQLSGRDAAFVTELVSGTIRRRGTYDAILAACVDRPLSKVEAKVLDALRLGTHQLLSMRVPAHAAISTTVDLVRAKVSSGAAGFANAVLRRVSEQDLEAWIGRVAPDPKVAPVRYAAIAYSHPQWVVEELRNAVGWTELHELLEADNAAPSVTLVARPGRATREELPGEPTPWSPYGVVLDGGEPGAVPAVAEGRAGVQDEGSQLVAMALAAAPIHGPDRTWLDLCAGPGGKAALLAALAARRGAGVVAGERQPHRARLVARALDGAEGVLGVVTADGTAPPWRAGTFDRVLVDAPCTGLGALRRRPEARWRRKADDLLALVLLQRSLVAAALDLVRPGGVVLYATCSPVLAETEGVVASVLQSRSDVRLEDATTLLPGVPNCAGPMPGTVQLWPHRHGTDAMFMALLRRE
ncbi:RsmB/NOP family class I SAM-dependent RNA methyltransferase [Nocardioides panaciterrulae]|uniref:16S rRNA (Cytosine967-C5)-methyltransferase n=1 Tax=Nocardioides panaciterrulae TaxID=661492 RepID=A0A7Y9E6C9_9ACTN|nr:transcription antitermination factor NusB [Nocardioides panaciterrulae]NYD42043.1 16S rRNA (cytosine967-C5)-methyltransferase [Nocardioides panaciterrulae]